MILFSSFPRSLCADGKITLNISANVQQAVSRLDAVMRASGGSVGFTTVLLVGMAGALQNTTRFGDEAINAASLREKVELNNAGASNSNSISVPEFPIIVSEVEPSALEKTTEYLAFLWLTNKIRAECILRV